MTTKIISKLAPKNNGQFPTHEDIHGEGGFQVRNDLQDRDSIPAANRKEGMWVKVLDMDTVYTLVGGITNSDWQTVSFGGGGGGAVVIDGGSPENIKAVRAINPTTDNTKSGIVNLGNDHDNTGSFGVSGNYGTVAGGDQNNVTADFGTIGGGAGNNIGGTHSTVCGGEGNYVFGDHGVVCGGYSCQAGANAFVGSGYGHNANGSYSTVCGGALNNATGFSSSVLGGHYNNAVGDYSVCLNQMGTANGEASLTMGQSAVTNKHGQMAHANGSISGTADGSNQYTRVILSAESIEGATVDFSQGNTATTGYILESNKNYGLKISVVAAQTGGLLAEYQTFDILISVDNGGASTVLPASPPSPTVSLGAGSYVIDYTTSTNLFLLNFTGLVGATVRATATIEATELMF